jgi:hypothetical protein
MSDKQLVKVGDCFLVTKEAMGCGRLWNVGDVARVFEVDTDSDIDDYVFIGGADHGERWLAADLLAAPEFRRVPPGYVVPPVAEWLAAVDRLVAAKVKMLADPETGTRGVAQCIDEMAAMAGIEVGA